MGILWGNLYAGLLCLNKLLELRFFVVKAQQPLVQSFKSLVRDLVINATRLKRPIASFKGELTLIYLLQNFYSKV